MNHPILSAATCLLLGLCLSLSAAHGAKPGGTSAADDQSEVARVLQNEIGGPSDRRAALGKLLQLPSVSEAVQWQAGFVRDGEEWRSFDASATSLRAQERLEEYRARREAAPATREGQLQLADWCRAHALPDQERAHLNAVLAMGADANSGPVLERLGYLQIGGRWLSREQLSEWREYNRQTEAALKRFGPRLERIAKQLAGARRQRAAGLAALEQIKEREAISAIELSLANRDESAALAVVEAFAGFVGHEAAIALAKQAVFSKWPSVREAAAQALKARPFEHFVPQLAGLLSTPIEGKVEIRQFGWRNFDPTSGARWRMQSGVLEYAYIMKRETGDQIQVARLNTINSVLDDYLDGTSSRMRSGRLQNTQEEIGNDLFNSSLARGANDALRAFRDDIHRKDLEVDRQNEFIHEMNERVGAVLATVSGQSPSAQPQTWWNWWNAYNDVGGDKPVVRIVDETETVGNLAPVVPGLPLPECFIAGTPVWTESGAVAIERIRVGDRVLAKNVETGKLAYKPVLQTTIRPPKELLSLRVGEETIVCTGGHRFWISGSGWVRARDLATSSFAHTASGTTPIVSAEKGQSAETYNLVVADWHTYFVGTSGILSQDVELPRPTSKVVPGLDRSQIVADGR